MEIPDFDYWKTLFEEDPELFDKKRQEFLEEYIRVTCDGEDRQQRARAILWRMEQNYRHLKDPIARFNKVVEEFWTQTARFQQALDTFKDDK